MGAHPRLLSGTRSSVHPVLRRSRRRILRAVATGSHQRAVVTTTRAQETGTRSQIKIVTNPCVCLWSIFSTVFHGHPSLITNRKTTARRVATGDRSGSPDREPPGSSGSDRREGARSHGCCLRPPRTRCRARREGGDRAPLGHRRITLEEI